MSESNMLLRGYLFSTFKGSDITPEQFRECSALFGTNYGVWGAQAAQQSAALKPGSRVKLPPTKLRTKLSLDLENTLLCTCRTVDGGALVGHAFATVWESEDDRTIFCWITQLVVHAEHRRHGIASTILRKVRTTLDSRIYSVGIASSHPGACMALARSLGLSMKQVDLSFTQNNAYKMLSSIPVDYLRKKLLRGRLFDPTEPSDVISLIDTGFYVDHEEPLRAQSEFERERQTSWPLGPLVEGHEFVMVLEV